VPTGNRWLKLRTVGDRSNRDGIGARATVVTGVIRQIREVRGGSSYLSHNSTMVEFGLSGNNIVDTLVVAWPSGIVDRWTDVAVNQTFTVVEGSTAPLGVTILNARGENGGVRLTWETTRTVGVQGYRVYRMESGSSEALLNPDSLITGAQTYLDATALGGRAYSYVVGVVDSDTSEVRSPSITVQTPSTETVLDQNYPNPFNPETTISFNLTDVSNVSLVIYDGKGRPVRVLATGEFGAGPHEVVWDGTTDSGRVAASGIYFYRLATATGVHTRKMALLK
jgi:hypothetical protein